MTPSSDQQTQQLQSRLAARNQVNERLTQARDALSHNVYRLDTLDISLKLVEEELEKLDSISVTGVLSSLLGTKASKIDAFHQQCDDLQREQKQCEQAVQSLTRQVEQLSAELAEYADVAAETKALNPSAEAVSLEGSGDMRRRWEHALDAAESLVTHLGGMFKLCNRLRSGPNPYGRCGALIAAGAAAYRSNVADGVNSQIAESVRHLCAGVRQLGLNPENASDAEMLAALARIENFADPSGNVLAGGSDAWAELEVLARGFVSDLEQRLSHCPR